MASKYFVSLLDLPQNAALTLNIQFVIDKVFNLCIHLLAGAMRLNFNTGPYGDPLKNQDFENRVSVCWRGPNFHEPRSANG